MKEHTHLCEFCQSPYGIELSPYIVSLEAPEDTWEAVVWCKCNRDSFGIRLTLSENNVSLGYKKIQLFTTRETKPFTFIYEDELPSCEVCSNKTKLNEIGLYWVCNDSECVATAVEWCHIDIDECVEDIEE